MDKNRNKLTRNLLTQILINEQNEVEYFQQLLTENPGDCFADVIEKIRDNEIRHFILARELFCRIFRCEPKMPPVSEVVFTSIGQAVGDAIDNKTHTIEKYRDIYMSNSENYIKELFFELMTDEILHTLMLTKLFKNI